MGKGFVFLYVFCLNLGVLNEMLCECVLRIKKASSKRRLFLCFMCIFFSGDDDVRSGNCRHECAGDVPGYFSFQAAS